MPNWTKEQEQAIFEEGTNIIVSAGAGSGKTEVLSERVLQKLLKGTKINELLILTFTNAAALEMKNRIQKKMQEKKLDSQIKLLDSAYITTFDAYALSLVKKYYYLLNINRDMDIGDESIFTLLKEQVLEDIFNDLYEEDNLLFKELVGDFCVKDDNELKELILKIDKSLDLESDKITFLDNFIDKYYADDFLDNLIKRYEDLLLSYVADINDLVLDLTQYVSANFISQINASLENLFKAKNYKEIKISCLVDLPRMERGSGDAAKKIKEQISKKLKHLEELTRYEDSIAIKASLLKTKNYAIVITEILKRLEKQVLSYKEDKGIYDFMDIAKMAIKILRDNPLICEEIKNSFKEILIDEYQDTSDLQDAFISLIENNNVYMVGDVKQSIYRFRNANPNLFRMKYNNYAKSEGGRKIDLTKNFRSRKEVIDNINLLFSYLMDDDIGMANYRLEHQMIYGNNDYAQKDNINYDMDLLTYEVNPDTKYTNEEIEAFTIAKSIKSFLQNDLQVMDKKTKTLRKACYSDFCILMDKSKNFSTYKKIFEYLGIPTAIYQDTTINETEDLMIIKNIFNLLVCIANKNYDKLFSYAFLSVGRSYLVNYSDEYLFDVITNKKYYETPLYQKLSTIMKDYESLTPSLIFERIIEEFDVYNKIITVGNVSEHTVIIDYLHDLFLTLEKLGYTFQEVSEYLNNITEKELDIKFKMNQEEGNACKIMTIHASKGLEFPVCYFSGLSSKFNIRDLNERISYHKDLGLIMPYKQDEALYSSILKELNAYNYYQEEISEKIRLFYVALTRTKEKMILVSPIKESDSRISHGLVSSKDRLKYRSFTDIVSSLEEILTPYQKNLNLEQINLTKNYKLSLIKQELSNEGEVIVVKENPIIPNEEVINTKYSKESLDIYDEESIQNINFGLLCHKELENVNFKNPNYDNMNELVAQKIKAFIKTGITEEALNIYQEYEFIWENSKGVIDLLIENEDKFIIVDYKLKKTQDEAYKKQVKGYKDYLKTLTDKNIETYLYSILDEELIPIN